MLLFRECCLRPFNGSESIELWEMTDIVCGMCGHMERAVHPADVSEIQCDRCEFWNPLPTREELGDDIEVEVELAEEDGGEGDGSAYQFLCSIVRAEESLLDEAGKRNESTTAQLQFLKREMQRKHYAEALTRVFRMLQFMEDERRRIEARRG